MEQIRIDELVAEHARALSARLQAHRAQLFAPDSRKTMRRFTSGEAAKLLGVNDAYLRKLHLEGRAPQSHRGLRAKNGTCAGFIRQTSETIEPPFGAYLGFP